MIIIIIICKFNKKEHIHPSRKNKFVRIIVKRFTEEEPKNPVKY